MAVDIQRLCLEVECYMQKGLISSLKSVRFTETYVGIHHLINWVSCKILFFFCPNTFTFNNFFP